MVDSIKRAWRLKRKEELIKILGGSCQSCGIEYDGINGCIFDFHHIDEADNSPSPRINRWLGSGKFNELKNHVKDNTILLCANCHRMLHKGRAARRFKGKFRIGFVPDHVQKIIDEKIHARKVPA
jgi:hypothetical protein